MTTRTTALTSETTLAPTAAEVFQGAAERFLRYLYVVTDPRIRKPNAPIQANGEPTFMSQQEMYDAYKGVIAHFRRSIADLADRERNVCMRHLRSIEELARQIRFSPVTASETTMLQQKADLRKNVAATVTACAQELAKLPASTE